MSPKLSRNCGANQANGVRGRIHLAWLITRRLRCCHCLVNHLKTPFLGHVDCDALHSVLALVPRSESYGATKMAGVLDATQRKAAGYAEV